MNSTMLIIKNQVSLGNQAKTQNALPYSSLKRNKWQHSIKSNNKTRSNK
jgi:hypothetical protein